MTLDTLYYLLFIEVCAGWVSLHNFLSFRYLPTFVEINVALEASAESY